MSRNLLLLQLQLLFILLPYIYCIDGPYVCIKEEDRQVIRTIPAQIPYEVTKNRCWPLYCPHKKIEYRDGYKNVTVHEKVKVKVCCEGYTEANRHCIPICVEDCVHGVCSGPNECRCEPGWTGAACNVSCPAGMSGPMCETACNCVHSTSCNAMTGECYCKPGWMGSQCSEPCANGTYGIGCLNKCICKNGAQCDHITGACKCTKHYTGRFCEIECPNNSVDCSQCYCVRGECHPETGLCKCSPGYTGINCNQVCPSGTYGMSCKERCDCSMETHFCDNVRGCIHKGEIIAPVMRSEFRDGATSSSWFSVAMIFMSAALVGLLVLFLIHRRRAQEAIRKLELNVTYTAEDPSDKFENPMYAYATTPPTPPPTNKGADLFSAKSLLSMKPAINDLGSCRTTNVPTTKKAFCEENPYVPEPHGASSGAIGGAVGGATASGYSTSTLKSYNYSPNIYRSDSDDLSDNKESIYEELKCKEPEDELEPYYAKPKPLNKNIYESLSDATEPKSPEK